MGRISNIEQGISNDEVVVDSRWWMGDCGGGEIELGRFTNRPYMGLGRGVAILLFDANKVVFLVV